MLQSRAPGVQSEVGGKEQERDNEPARIDEQQRWPGPERKPQRDQDGDDGQQGLDGIACIVLIHRKGIDMESGIGKCRGWIAYADVKDARVHLCDTAFEPLVDVPAGSAELEDGIPDEVGRSCLSSVGGVNELGILSAWLPRVV